MTGKRIVIVGGGAGGLALASKLGRKLGHKQGFDICLVDRSPIHIWKPKLHEVAVGVIDQSLDGLLYRDHGLKMVIAMSAVRLKAAIHRAKRSNWHLFTVTMVNYYLLIVLCLMIILCWH